MRSAALVLAVLGLAFPAWSGEPLPDPTRPEIDTAAAAEPVAAASRWVLRAVLIGPGRRVALINGRAAAVGDSVEGALVLAIEEGRVRIRTPDGERMLALAGAVNVAPAGKGSRP